MIEEKKTQTPMQAVKTKPKNKIFTSYIDGVTLGMIPILLIVVAMLYMTQISLSGVVNWQQLGVESVILYVVTMSIYMLLRSYSRRRGRDTDGWKNAFNTVETNSDKIIEQGYSSRTVAYCRNWETEELANSRSHVLSDGGITLDEFNAKYLIYTPEEIRAKYPDLSEHQYKTLKRAKRIKRLHYDENYLSVYNKSGRRKSPSGYMQVKTLEKLNVARVFITTAFSSVFMGSIVLEVIQDPTFATVVMCLVKIVVILFSGVMGMIGGYNITAVKEVEEMNFKADEQRRFIIWCAADKQQPKEPAAEKQQDTAI